MALPLYALTLFVSAFILFLVQPIVGKILLPKLGGTPQVWNTCMMFFQMVLLAGYAYTHNASTRLTLRQQLLAHLVLLCLPLIVLLPFPFALGGAVTSDGSPNPYSLWGFVPDLGANPIPSTLKILFTYVALPFLVVATTAPLLQKWFVYTGHPASKDPYFLYGASNFGSMLSLILYPILIEPYVSLKMQGWLYTGGYLLLGVFVLACAAMVWNASAVRQTPEPRHDPAPEPAPVPQTSAPPAETAQTGITATAPSAAATSVKPGQPGRSHGKAAPPRGAAAEPSVALSSEDLTPGRRIRWVLLAAIPSSLMLGITTHITTDLSPIPLFWLVPLILYIGSFILVFARWPVVWTGEPHKYFLYAQPFCVALMIIVDVLHLTGDTRFLLFAIFAHVLGFFTTTMVCHGELAKDRPSTKHLTEFYLWMSVGGMLGGLFNALIAPVLFRKLWEFPIAIFGAVIVRPRLFDVGFLDNWIAGLFNKQPEVVAKPGHKGQRPAAVATGEGAADDSFVSTLDIAWPIVILVVMVGLMMLLTTNPNAEGGQRNLAFVVTLGLVLACLGMARPLRVGLGIGLVLLVINVHQGMFDQSTIHSRRSFFGAMSVKQGEHPKGIYRQLIHGHIDHGMNFVIPEKGLRGNPDKDLSRLATTYYHREGPAGRVMEKYNWWSKGAPNTYSADARLPTSLLSAVGEIGMSTMPLTLFANLWSEPPFATVGLGTGTMASYGRPYQHVHFYEIDNVVLRFSLAMPTNRIHNAKQYQDEKDSNRETYFNYLEEAMKRGSTVQVLMGDARLRMALPYKNHYRKDGDKFLDESDPGGGPEKFYHMMVVDAFSSDAIPAHLLTREAFEMYFGRLREDGILCVHTSNRFVDLPKVVSAIAADMGYAHLRGHDNNQERNIGHYTSEWVMVARKFEYLQHLSGDTEFLEKYETAIKKKQNQRFEQYWKAVPANSRYLWTDDYYNLMSVVRFFGSRDD